MDELIGETVEVERAPDSPRPVRFRWRGESREVVEVLREWVDAGHGDLPPHSRRWYNRRHRRGFDVRDAKGERFILFLDYSHREHPTWFLARKVVES